MEIRRAEVTDIDDIAKIYEKIHDEEEQGLTTTGWIRNVYPIKKTAEDALSREDLFVMTDENKVVAAAVINQIQVDEYKYAKWKCPAKDDEIMVLHCLAVAPFHKNKGYGKAFVAYYEKYAEEHGCVALRMDTNAKNARARNLYQCLGYEEAGIVKAVFNGIPDVQLVCLEKCLRNRYGGNIGTGSIVTKDIPSNVIAVGNPCRVIRNITDKDKTDYLERIGGHKA